MRLACNEVLVVENALKFGEHFYIYVVNILFFFCIYIFNLNTFKPFGG
jgi:hypothetical protein